MPVGQDGNGKDRKLGEYWEDQFIQMAKASGWEAWPFQRRKGATFTDRNGKRFICPDVWILRRGNRQYACEIKHKDACAKGYGFEEYRAKSLVALEREYSNQFGHVECLYVVHNHARAGGKWNKTNRRQDWEAQRIKVLEADCTYSTCSTYYNGAVTKEAVPIHYYKCNLFTPIDEWLGHDIL